jgi:hypothetical protein
MRSADILFEPNRLKTYTLILALLTSWFITHPYFGIQHDALLYATQALSHLYPEHYKNDIFIRYGLQDQYTLFSWLHAFAISVLGLGKATVTLTLLGQALWLSASFFLARVLLTGKSFWVFLVLLFTLPGYYGDLRFLSYGESFLTPRLFSEALALLSIAFFIKKNLPLSITMLLVSFLIHPLMAAYATIFLLIYSSKVTLRSITLRLLLTLIPILLLAGIGIEPLTNLFQTMDAHWYHLVNERNPMVLVQNWTLESINSVILDCSIILSATIIASDQQRRVLLTGLLTGLGGFVTSLLGADLSHNVLFIQLQFWRALWFTHWFAYFAFALLITNQKITAHVSKLLCLCYFIGWLSLRHAGGMLVLVVHILFHVNRQRVKEVAIPELIRPFGYLLIVLMGTLWIGAESEDLFLSLKMPSQCSLLTYVILFLYQTRLFFTIALLIFWKLLSQVTNRVPAVIILSLMIVVFTLTIVVWDMRPQELRESEQFLSADPFKNRIPIDSVVYWQDSLKGTWLTLGRSSYASAYQGAAVLFSRVLALKYEKRLRRLEALGVKDSILSLKERRLMKEAPGFPTLKGLVHVCHDPELDFVVLSSKFQPGLVDEYYDKKQDISYYLYDCQCLR